MKIPFMIGKNSNQFTPPAYPIVLFILFLFAYLPSEAQDYVINRGTFSGFYNGSLRMCVVDKNEYYAPYFVSPKINVRQYKNGNVTNWGNSALLPDASGGVDIARDPINNIIYIAFFNAAADKIYTYKRGPLDDDWQLVCSLDKPATYLIGYMVRLSFNPNSQSLFMAFTEQTSAKVYFYELVAGAWVNRAGAASLSCTSNRIDLVSYGNKVILTTSPAGNLRVHVYDISTTTVTNLNQNISNVAGFATTAYESNTNTYVSFFAQSAPWMNLKVVKSIGGADWTDMTGTLTGAMDNGSWGGYLVYNEAMSRYSLFYSTGFIKGYTWNGTDWAAITLPYMASTNMYAIPNYKDVYYLAWTDYTPVGIYTTNETPTRNTVSISTTPTTTSCVVNFPQRGDGNKVVVFIKKSVSYDAPVVANNTTYTANSVFRSGTQIGSSEWYCVYNGVGETVTITSLDANATYQLQAFEYNGVASAEMYSPVTAVTGNPVSFVAANVLPVRWLSFTAKEQNHQLQLEWSTSNEENNEQFIVERSAKGKIFEAIGTVAASVRQETIHSYTFTDIAPLKNGGFYRIKQLDKDGRFEYSAVVQVRAADLIGIKIGFSPVTGTIQITMPTVNADTRVELYDFTGQQLVQKRLLTGRNDFNITHLTKAMYIVKIIDATGVLKTATILR